MGAPRPAQHRTAGRVRGFTIVELLIVIVVIAVLATISIVAYNGIQKRAQAAAAASAAGQAAQTLGIYQVDNGAYPTDSAAFFAAVGADTSGAKGNATYQYSVNNSSNPQTYCVTATVGTQSEYVSSTNTASTSGGCPGHGSGGVAAVTNLATNPSFESGTGTMALYNGSTMNRVSVGDAASGGYVLRITRGAAGSGLLAMYYPISYTANTPVSVRFKMRLSPGSTPTNTVPAGFLSIQSYQSGSGTGGATGCTKSVTPSTLSTTSWSDVVIQGCTTPNVTMNSIGIWIVPGQSWAATDGVDVDALIITQSLTVPNFADGNSTDWVWNGAANNSTSTGPAQ